jgi:hypothetical protein
MAGCYTVQGPFFDVDTTLTTIADVLEEQNLPRGVRVDLESLVEDFRCDRCHGVKVFHQQGPGLCVCD